MKDSLTILDLLKRGKRLGEAMTGFPMPDVDEQEKKLYLFFLSMHMSDYVSTVAGVMGNKWIDEASINETDHKMKTDETIEIVRNIGALVSVTHDEEESAMSLENRLLLLVREISSCFYFIMSCIGGNE